MLHGRKSSATVFDPIADCDVEHSRSCTESSERNGRNCRRRATSPPITAVSARRASRTSAMTSAHTDGRDTVTPSMLSSSQPHRISSDTVIADAVGAYVSRSAHHAQRFLIIHHPTLQLNIHTFIRHFFPFLTFCFGSRFLMYGAHSSTPHFACFVMINLFYFFFLTHCTYCVPFTYLPPFNIPSTVGHT